MQIYQDPEPFLSGLEFFLQVMQFDLIRNQDADTDLLHDMLTRSKRRLTWRPPLLKFILPFRRWTKKLQLKLLSR